MTEDFEKILHKLGAEFLREVEAKMSGQSWKQAILDVRYDRGGKSWMSKIRVTTSDPKKTSIRVTREIDDLLAALNQQRRELKDPWYGLMLKLGADRKCNMVLSYDEKCSDDPSFFDD